MTELKCTHFETGIVTFLESIEMHMPQNHLKGLMDVIPNFLTYEEEESKISPQLLIGDNCIPFVEKTPNVQIVITNVMDLDKFDFTNSLKGLIPFCTLGWFVIVDFDLCKQIVRLGLVKLLSGPQGLTLKDELIDSDLNSIAKFIFVEVETNKTLILTTMTSNSLKIDFRISDIKHTDVSLIIDEFAVAVIEKYETTHHSVVSSIIQKQFKSITKHLHGSICLIVSLEYDKSSGITKDGIWLQNPISLARIAEEAIPHQSLVDVSSSERLYSTSGLLMKMLDTDGITIVNNKGELLAYNVFVKPEETATICVTGGARRRAFHFLKTCNHKGFIGVYFQSQDGYVEFERIKHE